MMHPTHDDVLAELKQAFPLAQRDTALSLLNDFADAVYGPDRGGAPGEAALVETALVRLSAGRLDALRDWVEHARRDPAAVVAEAERTGLLSN